jgi:hypothetical protein
MESNYAPALAWPLGLVAIVFALFFRPRLRQWLAKRGFRRTGVSAANAFLTVQNLTGPRVEYVLQARQEERTEEDDSGDPPDPENHPLSPQRPLH